MKNWLRLALGLLILALPVYGQDPYQILLMKATTNGGNWGNPRFSTTTRPTCNTSNLAAKIENTTTGTEQRCNGSAWVDTSTGGGITVGGAISGGTDTSVLFDNAGVIGENPAFTFGGTNNVLLLGGSTLGSELAPALTAGNWTVGAGWESPIVGPGLIKNADGVGTQTPSAATTIVAGVLYKVTITLSAWSVGSATYTLGGETGASTLGAATTYTNYVRTSTTGKLIITPTNTSRFTISAISIKAVSTPAAGNATCMTKGSIGGGSATDNFLNCTGTLPTTLSSETVGALFAITGDNDTQNQAALKATFAQTGAVGNAYNSALWGVITPSATAAGSVRGVTGQIAPGFVGSQSTAGGWFENATLNASGYQAGVYGQAIGNSNDARNRFGVVGQAGTNNGAGTGLAVGVYGNTLINGGSSTQAAGVIGRGWSGATAANGGYFFLNATGNTDWVGNFGIPTITGTAALVADNAAVAANIFEARDNGTAVFTIADGGNTTFTAKLYGSGSGVLYSVPSSSAFVDGIGSRASQVVSVYAGGGDNAFEWGYSGTADQFRASSGAEIVWNSSSLGSGSIDTYLRRGGAAATLQLGAADVNGTPVSQTWAVQNAVTGTDLSGGTTIHRGSLGTGAGVPGALKRQVGLPLGTGTTQQSGQDREILVGKRLALADNTATTLFTFPLGNDTHGGGSFDFCVYANDNTNDGRQITCGEGTFTGVDKTAGAGGEACGAGLKGTNVTSLSPTNGGTILTVTVAATTGTDLCNVRVTADSDLAVITNITIAYNVRQFCSSGTCSITPQ